MTGLWSQKQIRATSVPNPGKACSFVAHAGMPIIGPCQIKSRVTARHTIIANSRCAHSHFHLGLTVGMLDDRRVLPAFYSHNYVTLAPEEQVHMAVEFRRSSLKRAYILLFDGWNSSLCVKL